MALLHTAVWLVLLGALATLCAVLWPANLGGRTTYVSTHGTSMIPRFHAGDLAIVQPASAYRVGDIAAYRSTTCTAPSCCTASSRSATDTSRSRVTTTTFATPITRAARK